jgi:hypothetical protein
LTKLAWPTGLARSAKLAKLAKLVGGLSSQPGWPSWLAKLVGRTHAIGQDAMYLGSVFVQL